MTQSKWFMPIVILCALLSAPAALPVLLEHGQGGLDWSVWATALVCTLVSSVCLFISTGFVGRQGIPLWSRTIAAMSLAVLGPLAVVSILYQTRSNLALAAIGLAVTAHLMNLGVLRWSVGLLMTLVACALDATALVWPIGCLCSGLLCRRDRGYAMVLLAAGSVGVVVAHLLGWPLWTGYTIQGAVYALHRDAIVLMPVIVLGLAGLARGFERRTFDPGVQVEPCLLGWAAAGICALMLAVLGWPMDVRLAVLGLWWLVPIGLVEMAQLLSSTSGYRSISFRVGVLSAAAVAALSLAGLRGWCDGLLLTLYLWTER